MRIMRWVGIAVGVVAVAAAAVIAAAPTIISTSWGKNTCLGFASRTLPGTVELDSLSAGWLSGVELHGLSVKDAEGRPILSCARFALDKPLLSLLVSRRDLGSIAIDSPALFCYAETSLKKEPEPPKKKKRPSQGALTMPDIRAKIDISGAKVIAVAGKTSIGQIDNGSAALNLDLLHSSTGKVSGDLGLNASKTTPLSLAFSLDGAPDLSKMKGSFTFSCQGVPTDLLAVLASSVNPQIGDFLKEAFGSKLSYSVSAELTGPNVVLHSILDSDNVRSDINIRVQDSVATVKEGPLLTGTITPRLFTLLTNQKDLLKAPTICTLENKTPLSVQLDPLRLAAPMEVRLSTKNPFALTCGMVGIDSSIHGEGDVLHATVAVTAASQESTARLTLTGSATPKEDGYHISSKTVLDGRWPLFLKNAVDLSPLVGESFSAEATFKDLVVDMKKGLSATLSSPATITFAVAPQELPNGVRLSHPVDMTVTIAPFSLVQANGAIKGAPIKVSVQSREIACAGPQPIGPYTLSVPMILDVWQRQIKIEPVLKSKEVSLITGTATIHVPSSPDLQPTAEGSFTIQQLPTSVLEAFSGQPLASLIGSSVSSTASCTFNGCAAKGNTLALTGSGSFWKARLQCSLDNMKLSGNQAFEGTFSPAWVDGLKKSDLTIAQPVTVQISVPTFFADLSSFLSPTGSQSPWALLETCKASATLSTSALEIRHQSSPAGRISPLLTKFDIEGSHVDFSISAPAGTPDTAVIAAKGSCDGLWNGQGLTLSETRLISTVDVDRFPVRVLDIVAPGKGALFEEAIGKTIRLTGSITVDKLKSGTATFDLSAKNCSAHFDGTIQNGVLTLKEAANASLALTKDTGSALLKDVSPLLATAVRSEKPIRITVDPKGTSIPLSPFSLTKVEIPKITADVGKIIVKNGGALKAILAILGMGNAANGDDLDVWLTPLYLTFHGGTLTCQRADALVADKLHMITWGDIDLGRDRINMVVAIPEESLTRLRLKIITPTPERGLQIPITGSPSHPDIDTKRATARLAGAGIMNNIPDRRLQVLGGLIQAAATAAGDPDQPIPPPTTSPLPWERKTQ